MSKLLDQVISDLSERILPKSPVKFHVNSEDVLNTDLSNYRRHLELCHCKRAYLISIGAVEADNCIVPIQKIGVNYD